LARGERSSLIDFHGLPAIRWQAADGATAVATLQGAHLVSWIPAGGDERLYLSERSPFEAGRAIRGGVPVVFPQFGERGPLAHHGFARTSAWRLAREEGDRVVLALESSGATLRLWPHAFALELAITIDSVRLAMDLYIRNTGSADFAFSAALHTYLRISDDAGARLEGLRGVRYVDRGSTTPQVESRDAVTAVEPIDRAYLDTPRETRLVEGKRRLVISQHGFPDTVVWNPGRERTAGMADMPPDGYRNMLCVEAAAFEHPVVVRAGGTWTGMQALDIEK
jgi:glucose-6-phosphate 1-epimerase